MSHRNCSKPWCARVGTSRLWEYIRLLNRYFLFHLYYIEKIASPISVGTHLEYNSLQMSDTLTPNEPSRATSDTHSSTVLIDASAPRTAPDTPAPRPAAEETAPRTAAAVVTPKNQNNCIWSNSWNSISKTHDSLLWQASAPHPLHEPPSLQPCPKSYRLPAPYPLCSPLLTFRRPLYLNWNSNNIEGGQSLRGGPQTLLPQKNSHPWCRISQLTHSRRE